jgi:hypothetical protein
MQLFMPLASVACMDDGKKCISENGEYLENE